MIQGGEGIARRDVKLKKWKPFQKDHKVANKQNMKCGLNGTASLFSNDL